MLTFIHSFIHSFIQDKMKEMNFRPANFWWKKYLVLKNLTHNVSRILHPRFPFLMVSNVSSERLSILSIVSGCLSGSHQPVVFNTNQFAWLSILEGTNKEFWGFKNYEMYKQVDLGKIDLLLYFPSSVYYLTKLLRNPKLN